MWDGKHASLQQQIYLDYQVLDFSTPEPEWLEFKEESYIYVNLLMYGTQRERLVHSCTTVTEIPLLVLYVECRYASRVKLITNDAQKNSENKEIARLKAVSTSCWSHKCIHVLSFSINNSFWLWPIIWRMYRRLICFLILITLIENDFVLL